MACKIEEHDGAMIDFFTKSITGVEEKFEVIDRCIYGLTESTRLF